MQYTPDLQNEAYCLLTRMTIETIDHFHNFLFVDAISIRREQLCAMLTLAQPTRSVIKRKMKIEYCNLYVSCYPAYIHIVFCILPLGEKITACVVRKVYEIF